MKGRIWLYYKHHSAVAEWGQHPNLQLFPGHAHKLQAASSARRRACAEKNELLWGLVGFYDIPIVSAPNSNICFYRVVEGCIRTLIVSASNCNTPE